MESSRLFFRHWEERDRDALYEIAKDKEVGPPCGWKEHSDKKETEWALKTILIGNPNETSFAIIRKEDNRIIGNISLRKDTMRDNNKVMSLGYYLGKDYWHKGYMNEAGRTIMKYGFEKMGLEEISVEHFSYNTRSRNTITSLGFKCTGIIPHHSTSPDGKEIDLVIYIIEKEDFYALNDVSSVSL